MKPVVEFFFDVGSPASYLAWTQLPSLCRSVGARISWRPMLLGGVFQATGNASPASVPLKGRYMWTDMARYAQRYGVPMSVNPHFPINTLALMRGATGVLAREPDRLQDYLQAVFGAIWVDALNLNDPAVVAQVLQRGGFDPQATLALANDPEVKALLKSTTEEAVGRGVFGAPTMFVGDAMFWGQDRLEFVSEALARQRAAG